MSRRSLIVLLSLLAATACHDRGVKTPPTSPQVEPSPAPVAFDIVDSRDNADAVEHFYFIEPVDRRPKTGGAKLGPFDTSLEKYLALEIGQVVNNACQQPLPAGSPNKEGLGR